MRLLICLPLLLAPRLCTAWHTAPHQKITRAALDTLPKRFLDRFGAEAAALVEIYCMLPDRYAEMERFGFVRNAPGPRSAPEIRLYCVRPDGLPIHGATGARDRDLGSLVYLFERIITSLSENRPAAAARYAGVLSHFIADSLSPPHAASADQLRAMAASGNIDVHSTIERSIPEFALGDRLPRAASVHLLAAARATLDRCYAGAEQNRKDLPSMVKAACASDETALDVYRLRAGVKAAEILADTLYAVFRMSEAVR